MAESGNPGQLTTEPPVLGRDGKPRKIWTVGTLKYGLGGLLMLCVSLLWGDFIFFLLDQDLPHIFPLRLKELGASDRTIVLLLKTLPAIMVFVLVPAISFHSDRHRGKWGRRIPYLVWIAPIQGLVMVGIGCHNDLASLFTGGSAEAEILGYTVGQVGASLFILSALIIGFNFINTFDNTIYWYLFNDVVPREVMTRFMALYRIVMYLASMMYSKWILPNALTHFRVLFIAGGIAYTLGWLMMFLVVREGKYPPPPPLVLESTRWKDIWFTFAGAARRSWVRLKSFSLLRQTALLLPVLAGLAMLAAVVGLMGVLCVVGCTMEYLTLGLLSWLRWYLRPSRSGPRPPYVSRVSRQFADFANKVVTYFKECFTQKFYWYYFLFSIFAAVSWTSSGPFRLLRDRDSLGLTLTQIGDVGFWAALVSVFCMFPLGWLADKLHPVRVHVVASICVLLALCGQGVFAIYDFGPEGNLVYLYVLTICGIAIYGMGNVVQVPAAMILLPRERYGQFVSAANMLAALATIVGTLVWGEIMEYLRVHTTLGTWRYRLYPVWTFIFQLPAALFLILLYREWKKRGGVKNYTPPPV